MTTPSKISLTIFVILFLSASTYGFMAFRERNSDSKDTEKKTSAEQEASNDLPSEQNSVADDTTENSAVDADTSEEMVDENAPVENTNYLNISRTDCDNQCKDFTESADLKYCQEICGAPAIKKEVKEKSECEGLEDLEKDYCLKDLAITKQDISICLEIEDTNVLKTCKNRIAQDLLEAQK